MNVFKAGKYNIDLENKTRVMGILNVTPDSFSDGGQWFNPEKAVKRAFEIQKLGADILDIGAQSTRPGYVKISAEEELSRLYPVLKKLKDNINIPVSVDTFYPEVAKEVLELGASIINDVSGFSSETMFEVASKSNCGIIIMHSGEDSNIKEFFERKVLEAGKFGISKERICLDPGIGFSKDRIQDRRMINNLDKFKIKGVAMLVGISRKRVVSEFLENKDNSSKLPGTIAANTIAIDRGANIIRVHDVQEAIFASKVVDAIRNSK